MADVNLDYPNLEAEDYIDVWSIYDKEHGEEAGYTRALIQNYLNDDDRNYDSLSGDEKQVVDWYQDNVLDKWDDRVKDYQDAHTQSGNGDTVAWDEYNDQNTYIDHPTDTFTPPTTSEWTGGNNPNKQVSVSTEALRFIANQIGAVVDQGTVLNMNTKLKAVDLKPGGFAKAELLRQKINGAKDGDTGLAGDSAALMTDINEALVAIKDNLLKLANSYENNEDFNKMTAEDLNEAMDAAWGQITEVGQHGQTEGTTAGG